jgi:hypothetical protein
VSDERCVCIWIDFRNEGKEFCARWVSLELRAAMISVDERR